ncbi:DUF924 domain-containing protein [Trinickia violacea]|uniref:DUF924 domain-containing protein n=1 Tax=Trinickia violacea TaxID=2571746 RepID=A0A4P8ILU8_9BURK|nr:DUF924 family protein [Trinickia violacea]QCP48757.1 DUF924 domain-containing protein [Trinickia violacea]
MTHDLDAVPAAGSPDSGGYATLDPAARDVLDFWFGTPGSAEFGTDRKLWFKRDAAFDARLRERFGATLATALAGGHDDWQRTPLGALALVVVLDQFSRNCHRGSPRAFETDAKAVQVARRMVETGADRRLPSTHHRAFAYLPFEHDESIESQRESIRLFGELEREAGDAGYLDYAHRHARIIERFGRFPHRNAVLGRQSTDEEIAFLREPGSSF